MTDLFDYIVVGAGSAGCVLANRLSADSQARVLLAEAEGEDTHPLVRMPLGFLKALQRPELTWGYESEPEPQLLGKRLPIPRGRLLGGSSSINGMFHIRGHRLDYDEWRDQGCDGWGYEDVLPYFRRSESNWRDASRFHGADGPLQVRAIDTRRLLEDPLRQAAVRAGLWFPGFVQPKEHSFYTTVCLLRAKSRGRVSLRSARPEDAPRIALNLFSAPEDFVSMRAGLRAARDIYRTAPQADLIDAETIPGSHLQSDAELDQAIREFGGITHHPVGTCAMGIGPEAVVDPQLRVFGVPGLRVADASVMPQIPGANTNAATVMIAEKAADLILGCAAPRGPQPAPAERACADPLPA